MGNHACITAETSHTGFVLVALAFSDHSSFDMGGQPNRTDDHSQNATNVVKAPPPVPVAT